MAEKKEIPTVPAPKEEDKKIDVEGSDSDDGPLESESSDPDIDSSDAICT